MLVRVAGVFEEHSRCVRDAGSWECVSALSLYDQTLIGLGPTRYWPGRFIVGDPLASYNALVASLGAARHYPASEVNP